MTLYTKGDAAPTTLPAYDYALQAEPGEALRIWSHLADNPEGREACGWTAVPDAPDYDPTRQALSWDGATRAWVLADLPPPPIAPAPTAAYLPKVLFERRFTDAEFASFDRVRLAIGGRPADWSTSTAVSAIGVAWPALSPFVRAFSDYDAAGEVNLLDPAFARVMHGLSEAFEVFGTDGAADARIAALLTP